ncbi:MAG: hypothetical protein NT007_09735 [Candidatus Kapabacteria bacterium]|nr:hypothetical protein [Candidatus Kapabacteria bacterium]
MKQNLNTKTVESVETLNNVETLESLSEYFDDNCIVDYNDPDYDYLEGVGYGIYYNIKEDYEYEDNEYREFTGYMEINGEIVNQELLLHKDDIDTSCAVFKAKEREILDCNKEYIKGSLNNYIKANIEGLDYYCSWSLSEDKLNKYFGKTLIDKYQQYMNERFLAYLDDSEHIDVIVIDELCLRDKIREALLDAFRENPWTGWKVAILADLSDGALGISDYYSDSRIYNSSVIELATINQFYIDYENYNGDYGTEKEFNLVSFRDGDDLNNEVDRIIEQLKEQDHYKYFISLK